MLTTKFFFPFLTSKEFQKLSSTSTTPHSTFRKGRQSRRSSSLRHRHRIDIRDSNSSLDSRGVIVGSRTLDGHRLFFFSSPPHTSFGSLEKPATSRLGFTHSLLRAPILTSLRVEAPTPQSWVSYQNPASSLQPPAFVPAPGEWTWSLTQPSAAPKKKEAQQKMSLGDFLNDSCKIPVAIRCIHTKWCTFSQKDPRCAHLGLAPSQPPNTSLTS